MCNEDCLCHSLVCALMERGHGREAEGLPGPVKGGLPTNYREIWADGGLVLPHLTVQGYNTGIS
jgi:hypothetical protein